MNDIVIIGGGIAGLYSYYKLQHQHKHLKIKLFEKENYFGGRIFTVKKNINNKKYQYEAGAGRLNDNHILFLKLIQHMNLSNDLIKIKGSSEFIPTSHFKLKNDKQFKHKNAYYFIKKVVKAGLKAKKEDLIKVTFKEYALTILTQEEVFFMLSSSGYYGELVYENAFNALKIFNEGIRDDINYYVLKNGMSSIVDKLVKKIRDNKDQLYLNSSLKSIKRESSHYILNINNKQIKAKKIILALPKPVLENLNYLSNYSKELNSITCKSLCRIYSIFKEVWFKNIHKTTTNSNLRFIIPINKQNGLIMSSYSDCKYAHYWKKYLNKKKSNDLSNDLVKKLKDVFHLKIEKPIYNDICYWDCGVGFWNKNKNSELLAPKILQLNKEEDVYIVGENYSQNQGWIEGALETVEDLIQKLNI